MKTKLPELKSFLPPALSKFGDKLYAVPMWVEVPIDTTIEDIRKVWKKVEPKPSPGMYCSNEEFEQWQNGNWKPQTKVSNSITEKIKSSNGKSTYTVLYDNGNWNCECIGFSYRKTCKHVKEVQSNHKMI